MDHMKPRYALLIIDMINNLEFKEGESLFPFAYDAAKNIRILKKRVKENGIPTIYVNDNYGKWQSDFPSIVNHFLKEDVLGQPIVQLMKPDEDDYFILKPQFSGFFATPLELLLNHLHVNTLVLTGIAGDMCVHFTANDAYMRNYKLIIPTDCIASNTEGANTRAIIQMENVLQAHICTAEQISFN